MKGEPNVSYICSRYYRAPELIFGATDYTPDIGKSAHQQVHQLSYFTVFPFTKKWLTLNGSFGNFVLSRYWDMSTCILMKGWIDGVSSCI